MEQRFNTQQYKDRGLVVIGIDPNGDEVTGVQAFVGHIRATYQIGLEDPTTATYKAFTKNFKGLNPYPVDIVVGRDGKIQYVGREYDPMSMTPVIEAELNKSAM